MAISQTELEHRRATREERWSRPIFDEPLPEMRPERMREVERDFRAGGGLISTYAMKTKTHPVEAARDLMAAGMIDREDPLVRGAMANSSFLMAADGTMPGGEPWQPDSHLTTKLPELQGKIQDLKAAPDFTGSREAGTILAGAQKRLTQVDGQEVPSGMLAPSLERAARAIHTQWEAGGKQDKSALNQAQNLMMDSMLNTAAHVHVEKTLEDRSAKPVNRIVDAARRMAGRRAPQKPLGADQVEL